MSQQTCPLVQYADTAASLLKVLASPHRLRILSILAEGEQCVSSLIEATGIAPTSMSQHLAKLKEGGVVKVRRDHRTLWYAIDHPATFEVMALLERHFAARV